MQVSSSSLEKWGICQPPPSQTENLKILRTGKGNCARATLLGDKDPSWVQRPERLDALAGTVSDRMFSGEEVEGRRRGYKPAVLVTG